MAIFEDAPRQSTCAAAAPRRLVKEQARGRRTALRLANLDARARPLVGGAERFQMVSYGHGFPDSDFHRGAGDDTSTNPAWVIVDCRAKLDDLEWGAREHASSHIPGAVYADLTHDLSGPEDRHQRSSSVAGSAGAGADLQPSRHRNRHAGRGVRPGERDVREPAVVAAALARTRCRRRARWRVQEVDGRRTADRERRRHASAARVHRIAPRRDDGRRQRRRLASRRRHRRASSTRARRSDIAATPNRSTRSAVTFPARGIISSRGTWTSRDCSARPNSYARDDQRLGRRRARRSDRLLLRLRRHRLPQPARLRACRPHRREALRRLLVGVVRRCKPADREGIWQLSNRVIG